MTKTHKIERPKSRAGLCYKKAREFANLYRGDPEAKGNAAACYKKMHPKVKDSTARSKGCQYLNDPLVQELLEEHNERLTAKADVTQEMVLDELRKMAFFDIRKLYHDDGSPKGVSELDDDTAAAIVGLDAVNIGNSDQGIGQVLKYKLADKKGALELFGKHLKMWTDKVDHSSSDGSMSPKNVSDEELDARIAELSRQVGHDQ